MNLNEILNLKHNINRDTVLEIILDLSLANQMMTAQIAKQQLQIQSLLEHKKIDPDFVEKELDDLISHTEEFAQQRKAEIILKLSSKD